MLTRDRQSRPDRAFPTFITLVVLGILLMTFHVRLEGGGVVDVLRTGTQAVISPLQRGVAYVVTPIVEAAEGLGDIAGIREENRALKAALEESQAQLIAVQDQLARLDLFEALYGLDELEGDLGRTVANVIGRPDPLDAGLIIDRGTSHGIAVGQPVIDTNGFVVGSVSSVTSVSATIVPITGSREALAVLVGSQIGRLTSQVGSPEMVLEIPDAKEPVLAGARVLTSAQSVLFPAGFPVGEVLEDAALITSAVTTTVLPYVDIDTLRIVVVLAWPSDPVSASGQDEIQAEGTTTTLGETTTTGEGTTTTGGGG
ncbi:MAG: rod shape-determining protein MreC [Acidimicrobiia bacterium]